MTENSEGSGAHMEPPRMFTEQGRPDRAVVINYTLAWMIFMTAVTALCAGVWWVATIDGRVSALEARRPIRDAQFQGIDTRIDSLDGRLRPLEITAASIAFLSAQIADLNRRLDRNQGPQP